MVTVLLPTGGDNDVKSSQNKVMCEMYTPPAPFMANPLSPCSQLGLRAEIRPHVFRCSVLRVGISLMTIRHKEALDENKCLPWHPIFAQHGVFEKISSDERWINYSKDSWNILCAHIYIYILCTLIMLHLMFIRLPTIFYIHSYHVLGCPRKLVNGLFHLLLLINGAYWGYNPV